MRDSVMVGLWNDDGVRRREGRTERRMRVYLSMKKPAESSGGEASNVSMKDRVTTWSSVTEKLRQHHPKSVTLMGTAPVAWRSQRPGYPGSGQGGEGRPGILTIFHGHG